MNRSIFVAFCLMNLVCAAAPRQEKPWHAANRTKDELWKQGKTCAQIIDELEKMRGETYYATNAYSRAYIDRLIVGYCRRPAWTGLKRWDINLEQRIPAVVRRSLDDDEVGFSQKIELASLLAEYLAGENQFKEAETLLRKTMESPGQHGKADVAKGLVALSDLSRWQDRYEEAWKLIEQAFEQDPGLAVARAYALAKDLRDEKWFERADALAGRMPDVLVRLEAFERAGRTTDATRKLALETVRDAKLDPNRRAGVAICWFGTEKAHPEDRAAAFAALKDIDMSKVRLTYELNKPISRLSWCLDWGMVEDIFRAYEGVKFLADPRLQRVRLTALAADGKRDAALAVVATNLANAALKPLDRVKFEISKALLTGGDPEKVIAAAKLERKDEIAVALTAARQALLFGMNDFAERMSAKHATYFVEFGQRNLKVWHSRKPIESIADWRQVYDGLDRQVCDRKFGANLDALETDVATGRKAVEKTALDSADAQVEVSAISDAKGLHIFLRVEDPSARAVESGFAGGIGTEMYFAPGKYEPYVCFGSDPRTGVPSAFQTLYNSKGHRRIDMTGEKDKAAFRFESSFTDTDYVQHLFFAWDSFYQKLPANGSKWRFECLAFGPKGPFSLGGSSNVHNSSKWCDLEFQLTEGDVTAIRRGLLFRHVKGWAKLGWLDRFDKWADAEIGDPEFYNEVLKPIEAELKGYAKEVKPDMSDADVNRVFEKALGRWMGISYEIDALRREWMLERMCK